MANTIELKWLLTCQMVEKSLFSFWPYWRVSSSSKRFRATNLIKKKIINGLGSLCTGTIELEKYVENGALK